MRAHAIGGRRIRTRTVRRVAAEGRGVFTSVANTTVVAKGKARLMAVMTRVGPVRLEGPPSAERIPAMAGGEVTQFGLLAIKPTEQSIQADRIEVKT